MPKVYNKHHGDAPPDAVYVGRPSYWGNPFTIGVDGPRETVIEKYRAQLLGSPSLMSRLSELRGKDLVCFCAPKPCHGDVLLELSNTNEAT